MPAPPGAAQPGAVQPMARLGSANAHPTIGLDVGGTKLLGGIVAADGQLLHRERWATPKQGGQDLLMAIVTIVRELWATAGQELPVGIGIAGSVDGDGVVRFAPNIADLEGMALRAQLQEHLYGHADGALLLDNDANVAAWGEYRFGAGRGHGDSLVMLTIGTGVGGGLIQHGALVRGRHGMAGEVGHLLLQPDGPRCGCGNDGCLEALASGTAIGRLAQERLDTTTAPSLLRDAGPVTGKAVTIAAQSDDAFARDVLDTAGFWLGVGIASLVNALDPGVVIVGGGAMEASELLLGPARRAAQERLIGRPVRQLPPIVEAELGDDAGMVGAADLVRG